MKDLRTLEKDSIYNFVSSCGDLFRHHALVLDYGCGQQPYRNLVESFGADYVAYDRVGFAGNVSGEDVGYIGVSNWLHGFDAILCTQVVQYVPLDELFKLLGKWRRALLDRGGHLALTYPTTWPEVEDADLHRFTKEGMAMMLFEAGFTILRHERRAEITWQGETFALGYGVVARA